MKNLALMSILLILLVSCKTSKNLPKADSQIMRITGRWNNTDAIIAADQYKEVLQSSSWYLGLIDKDDASPNLYLFEVDYNGIQEPFDHTLEELISKTIDEMPHINLLQERTDNANNYTLKVSLTAEQIESFGERAMAYHLTFTITDAKGDVIQSDKQSIKKYISN